MALVTTTLFGQVTILPIPAIVPVRESLDWLTDVVPYYDGGEERHQVRNNARRRFDLQIPVAASEYQRAFNTVYGSRTNQWAVPLWTEAQNLGAVTGGLSSIVANTDYYDFRDSSLALLWASPRDWQVVEITTVTPGTPGSLAIDGTTNAFSNAWLMPIRLGHLVGGVSRQSNSYNGQLSLSYDLEDNISLSVSAPTQYLSNDIYFDEGLFGGEALTDRLIQSVDFIDGELGVVGYRSPWTNGKVSRPFEWLLSTPADIYAFRQFLYRRMGKYKAFWQPTFDSDFRVTSTGTVTTVLRTFKDDYLDHATNRTHIAVEDSAGNWYARNIDSTASISGTEMELTLDSALNVEASDIVRVSYLGLKRLETDKVELSWIGNGVMNTTVRILELSP